MYSTFKLKEKFGWKIDLLKDWMKREFISPSIQKASGAGTKNLFSRNDVYLIYLFDSLIKRGLARKIASERVKGFAKYLDVAGTWNDPSQNSYVGFIKRESAASNKMLENKYEHEIVILSDKCFEKKSLKDLIKSDRFDDIIVVNFKKIRKQVDSKLG